MMEENLVTSSTAAITTIFPHVVSVRGMQVAVQMEEGSSSASSFDSIEAFLNEPHTTQPNTVHTTGAEYEDILGMPLSEKLKNMTEIQRTIVLKKIKEAKRWKAKYLRNKRARKSYTKKIEEQKRKVEQLQKEIEEHRAEIKTRGDAYTATKKGLQETEEELEKFQQELKRKIRFNNEMARLQREKEIAERNLRIKSKTTIKLQEKLFNKAVKEKEIKNAFQENIDAFKGVSEILEEHRLIPAQRQQELSDNIVNWKMELALYKDIDMEEIKALHDGQ